MVAQSNYYDILGVPKNASTAQIKEAYRKLALKYHPDKSKDPASSQKFQEGMKAYKVLTDPKSREAYDHHGPEFPTHSEVVSLGEVLTTLGVVFTGFFATPLITVSTFMRSHKRTFDYRMGLIESFKLIHRTGGFWGFYAGAMIGAAGKVGKSLAESYVEREGLSRIDRFLVTSLFYPIELISTLRRTHMAQHFWETGTEIVRVHGLSGLWTGILYSLVETVFTGISESLWNRVVESRFKHKIRDSMVEEHTAKAAAITVASSIGNAIALSLILCPLQTMVVRFQCLALSPHQEGNTMIEMTSNLLREEGWGSLWSGLLPQIGYLSLTNSAKNLNRMFVGEPNNE